MPLARRLVLSLVPVQLHQFVFGFMLLTLFLLLDFHLVVFPDGRPCRVVMSRFGNIPFAALFVFWHPPPVHSVNRNWVYIFSFCTSAILFYSIEKLYSCQLLLVRPPQWILTAPSAATLSCGASPRTGPHTLDRKDLDWTRPDPGRADEQCHTLSPSQG